MLFTSIIGGRLGVMVDVLVALHLLAVVYWAYMTVKEINTDVTQAKLRSMKKAN